MAMLRTVRLGWRAITNTFENPEFFGMQRRCVTNG